jgi:DNA-binding beta-propeller fold protein YncE
VFSATGDSLVATVPGFANYIAAVPFPNKLYIGGAGGGTRVVDCGSHVVLDTIHGIAGPMLCDCERGKVYFAGSAASIVDARTDSLVKTIPLGRYPEFLCWNRTNSRVYISDFMDNLVYVIRDTTTGVAEEASRLAGPCWGRTVFAGTIAWPHMQPGALIDMSGRRVAELRQGSNELSRLAPGVYAVVTADGGSRQRIVKVR